MTNTEHQQLMEFLGRKFTEVVAEGLRSEIRQVAEGVLNVDEKLGRFRQEVRAELDEVKANDQALLRRAGSSPLHPRRR